MLSKFQAVAIAHLRVKDTGLAHYVIRGGLYESLLVVTEDELFYTHKGSPILHAANPL